MVGRLQFETLQQRIDASGIQTKGWITHGPIDQLPSKGIGAVAEMFRNGGMEFGVFPNRCGDSGTFGLVVGTIKFFDHGLPVPVAAAALLTPSLRLLVGALREVQSIHLSNDINSLGLRGLTSI